jgi:hypothetical protein
MDRSKPPPTPRKRALEALYATFNRYDGIHLEGCPHCTSFEDSAALRRAPVRRLGGELHRYLFKAMTTWGTEEDFKHFVPRLLELYASSADAWMLCDKLACARWRSWPELERGAVESYLLSLWRERLAEDGPPLPGVALLETMLSLDLDLAPYDLRTKLDAWRSARSRESMRSLARFVLEHGDALFWPGPSTRRPTLWQARPEIAAEVRAWLLEPATRAGLDASFLEHGDGEVARAFDRLEAAAQEM